MTIHNDYNNDLSLDGLEPGEHNPLDHEPVYNPLRYCYHMPAVVDEVEYEIAVKFQLQMHGETTPIDFVNPRTGNPHSISFFPKVPEIGLEPAIDSPEPNLTEGYQMGENPYYLVPTICRCKHQETGRLLTRDIATKLISPEILQEALVNYRKQVENDPEAPVHLLELLDMWDPDQACRFEEDTDGDDPWNATDLLDEDEDEDYYD